MIDTVLTGNGTFALYDCQTKQFSCTQALLERLGGMAFEELLDERERSALTQTLEYMAGGKGPEVCESCFTLQGVHCRAELVRGGPADTIVLTLREESGGGEENEQLTGLMRWKPFLNRLDEAIQAGHPGASVIYFDVQRFKAINNMFGMRKGDLLLRFIAGRVRASAGPKGFACHINSDRFVFYTEGSQSAVELQVEMLFDAVSNFDLPFEIVCNAGIYRLEGARPAANSAVDRAIMAQGRIKGSFTQRIHYYNDELHRSLMSEQKLVGAMRPALQRGEFIPYFQPQFDHRTKLLVGAEALVRWLHPEKGLIPPGQFIPVFENNGFISQIDLYVFQEVCAFQKERLEQGLPTVPISVNLTRYDLFDPGFLDRLETTRQRSGVPAKYMRIEITESSALGGSRFINEVLEKLHGLGYLVEMDDFGSGYSSLNILKDADFDMIKLDMRFFEQGIADNGGRGGIILSSVVRMVNWLQLPMIAEGVETEVQADFLQSIGCDYIQGYLYSKPLPEAEFAALLQAGRVENAKPHLDLIDTMDADSFWSANSLETMIFSNYVGGAAIFDYHKGGAVEILRVNKKYLQELGMNLQEQEVVNKDVLGYLDEGGRMMFLDMIERAIETGEEQECETWRTIVSGSCGKDQICIRCAARMIGRSKDSYIFYALIRNITAEKQRWIDILDSERRFKAASEQINIYYWEYTVATHEMRPCFRCMRDLGLPPLMTNYPESAIECGVFPPEVADQYRECMRKIDAGEVESVDEIYPLTVGRVPFHVRYTVESDENGRPVKAYGSAALVVDGVGGKKAG